MAAHITSNKAVKLVFARTLLLTDVNLTAGSGMSRRGAVNMARAKNT